MPATATRPACAVDAVEARAYRIPTRTPESDGTLQWRATTLVTVEIGGGGATGFGYTYADESTAVLIASTLRDVLLGRDAFAIGALWIDAYAAARNLGRGGVVSMAVSAVDVALWDLKGKLLDRPVGALTAAVREAVPVYGSGGFTSYSVARLCEQLSGWVEGGIPRVKMKVGSEPRDDPSRVAAARRAIGDRAELFVDANGAYGTKEALELARRFAESDVSWFEEPVFREDYAGTAFVRERVPAGMEIASGEYGYAPYDFARMLQVRCVDVMQADATRCGGYTGLLGVDAACRAAGVDLSTHCAPYLHLAIAPSCTQLRHAEYFFDHVEIERALFDGAPAPKDGALRPDFRRPGIGLEFKHADARRFLV